VGRKPTAPPPLRLLLWVPRYSPPINIPNKFDSVSFVDFETVSVVCTYLYSDIPLLKELTIYHQNIIVLLVKKKIFL
jgi:hypothetical protein